MTLEINLTQDCTQFSHRNMTSRLDFDHDQLGIFGSRSI